MMLKLPKSKALPLTSQLEVRLDSRLAVLALFTVQSMHFLTIYSLHIIVEYTATSINNGTDSPLQAKLILLDSALEILEVIT